MALINSAKRCLTMKVGDAGAGSWFSPSAARASFMSRQGFNAHMRRTHAHMRQSRWRPAAASVCNAPGIVREAVVCGRLVGSLPIFYVAGRVRYVDTQRH